MQRKEHPMQPYDKTLAVVGSAVLGACLIAGGIATVGKDLSVIESPALQFGADAADADQLKRQDSAGKAQAAEKAEEREADEQDADADGEDRASASVTQVPAPQPEPAEAAPAKVTQKSDTPDK